MLLSLFHIRKGEELRAILMLVHIFLVIFALMIIKPVSHAQFLSQFGVKQLPFVFILVAFFAALSPIQIASVRISAGRGFPLPA